ncbi:S-layer homology domain-containing protein [Brevibacillus sp. NPDC003359]|uniref:S-layer homology domain-containing protein n=1 Tax=unclassified Brevibacillus TaxID=2684853 RepID=UPI0036AFE0C4
MNRFVTGLVLTSLITSSFLLSNTKLPTAYATNVENSAPYDVTVQDGTIPKTKIVSWKGTTGIVQVEIKNGEKSVYKTSTRFLSVTLSKQASPGTYDVYLNNQKSASFTVSASSTGQDTPPPSNNNGSSPGESGGQATELKVSDGPNKTKMVEWTGTTGIVPVEVKTAEKTVYKSETRFTKIYLSNLSAGNYDVYVSGSKIGSFTIEVPVAPPPPTITDYTVSDGPIKGSKIISWKGTTGRVDVEVKQAEKSIYKGSTLSSKFTLSKVPAGTYDVYIANVKSGTVQMEESAGSGTPTTGGNTSSGKASNIVIVKKDDNSVRVNWSGTKGKILIELHDSDGTMVTEKNTSDHSIVLKDLDEDEEYKLIINGQSAGTFVIEDLSDNPYDLTLTKINNNGIRLSWKNSVGFVEVELKVGTKIFDADRTDRKSSTFLNLDPDEKYKVYIDGDYVQSFEISNLDEANKNKDIKNLRIKTDEKDGTIEVSWKGTTGTKDVSIKNGKSTVSSKRTDEREVVFYRIPLNQEYKIFIDGKYADSFRFGEVKGEATDIIVTTGSSPTISWTGTSGDVKVELKQKGNTSYSKSTNGTNITFSHLTPGSYDVFIDGQDVKKKLSVSKADSSTPASTNTSRPSNTFTQGFKDVPSSHWANVAIQNLTNRGIIKGFANGTFQPSNDVTREQFVTMLVQSKSFAVGGNYSPFADLPKDRWSTSYVVAAIEAGIVLPDEYGAYFAPEKPVTREEMAIMLARAEGLSPDTTSSPFIDAASISQIGLVQSTVKAGLIKGFPDNTFRPKGKLTRAEAAYVINLLVK